MSACGRSDVRAGFAAKTAWLVAAGVVLVPLWGVSGAVAALRFVKSGATELHVGPFVRDSNEPA